MPSKPRVGYATLDAESHVRLHAPFRYLPIVIVPDFMGTRLSDEGGSLVWNPLGAPFGDSPGSFTVKYDRLSQITAALVPDETNGFEDEDKKSAAKAIKHFYNLIPDLYGRLAFQLAGQSAEEIGDYQIRPKVYAAGYDWRMDNARSALRLAEVVEEALAETRERKVILVAHGMGGHVCRYYCRALGGESKVYQLFLVGSPTLGVPGAYLQLKNGVTGIYAKDIKDDFMEGDALGATLELLDAGGRLMSGIGALSTGQGWGSLKSFFGDIYLVLCLGAGRMLSRKETTYFVRQMPSVYQLLPGSIYCRDNQSWVIFDPLATGHPPTGKMLVFPTLLEGAIEGLGGALDMFSGPSQKVGSEMKDAVLGFLSPEQSERTSGRATRNMATLAEVLAEIGESIGSDPFGAVGKIVEIYERAERSFVDCRNPRQIYGDIYTGLLDHVALRAISAGNLALAYRFDKAVTVRPRDEKGLTPLELIKNILDPMLDFWKIALGEPLMAFGGAVGQVFLRGAHAYDYGKRIEDLERERLEGEQKEARDRAERERTKARAYVHPRTINIFCGTAPVEAGCFLLPLAIYSNDDSNVVRWAMIPHVPALGVALLSSAASNAFEASAMGDGTVPLRSASPGEDALSRALLTNHEVRGVTHGEMMSHASVVDYIIERVQGLVMGFYRT